MSILSELILIGIIVVVIGLIVFILLRNIEKSGRTKSSSSLAAGREL